MPKLQTFKIITIKDAKSIRAFLASSQSFGNFLKRIYANAVSLTPSTTLYQNDRLAAQLG